MRNPFRQFAKATPAPSSTALSSASFVSREYALAVGATTAGAIVLTYVIWRLFVKETVLEQATFDKGSVEDHFVLGDTCGAGAQGQVCLAQRKVKASDESDVVAVKLIRLAFDDGTEILNAADFEQLEREIAVTRQCDHPNVIKTLAAFYHPGSRVEMVMVAARGGEVAQELAERKQYSEADAQAVVRQAANALAYLHGRGIAHRDIKPENVLYADATKRQVKIVDFGFASSAGWGSEVHSKELVGTAPFMAPELFMAEAGLRLRPGEACLKGYGAKVDVWALGVFTFMLLTGELPFEGEFFMQFEKAITLGEWRFAADDAAALSDEAQAFVAACLTYDPAQRQSAAAASQHVWLRTECCPAPAAALERAHTRAARLGKVLERRRGVEKLRRAKNLIKTLRKMQPVLASAPSGA